MKSLALVFFLILFTSGSAQDVQFLNTNQNLVNLNPSFAGSNGGIRNQFSYTTQLNRYEGYPQSYSNNLDVFIKPIRAGIALTTNGEYIGAMRRSGIGATYAQHFSFNKGRCKLVPSVQVLKMERIINDDWIEIFGTEALPNKIEYVDVNGGLLFSKDDRLFVGVSVFHGNRLFRAYVLYGSYNLALGANSILQAVCNVTSSLASNSIQGGANLVLAKRIMAGIGYESNKGAYAHAGYRANTFALSVGYYKEYWNKGSLQLHGSFNLRDKEHRKTLTSFEKM